MRFFKVLGRLIKYKPLIYTGNVLSWMIVEAFPLLPVLIVKEIIDTLTYNTELERSFYLLVLALVAVYFGRIIFTYVGVIFGILFSFNAQGLMRLNLLQGILKKPGSKALTITPGEAQNRLDNDVATVEEILGWPIDVLGKLVSTSIAVIILFLVNSKITLFVVLPLFLVSISLQQIRKRVYKYRQESRAATGKVIGNMGEIFSSIQAIKLSGAETSVIENFMNLSNKRHQKAVKDSLFTKLLDSILSNVVHLGTGLILLISASWVLAGDISLGDFALIINYWFLVADFSDNFGKMVAAYHQAKVSHERVIEILDGDPLDQLVKAQSLKKFENKNSISVLPQLEELYVKGLSYTYPGTNIGVNNINLEIKKGNFIAITGKIGSGKTTLLRTLLGLLPKDAGEITWNDKFIEKPDELFVPPNVAYTGQIPHLFSDTVKENILLGVKKMGDYDISEAIQSAVLEEDIESLEQGLDTVIGPKGVKLSGGQLQRVAAARMFATNSQLYVFDDISSALDVNTETALWNRLFTKSDVTCIAVSNRIQALKRADLIIVIDEGEIVGKGKFQELLLSCDQFRQLHGNEEISA